MLTWNQFQTKLKGSGLDFSEVWVDYQNGVINDEDLEIIIQRSRNEVIRNRRVSPRNEVIRRKRVSPRNEVIRRKRVSPRTVFPDNLLQNNNFQKPLFNSEVFVTIYFVRHGKSCANLQKEFSILPKHWFYRDPELSRLGKEDSIRNGVELLKTFEQNNINIDYVASSSMLRAIETAYYMFKSLNLPINVVPYVIEQGITSDNYPFPLGEQMKLIEQFSPLDRFNFLARSSGEREKSDLNLFLKWLQNNLSRLAPHVAPGKHINIVLVTHSHFMKKYLNLSKIPANNAVVKRSFV